MTEPATPRPIRRKRATRHDRVARVGAGIGLGLLAVSVVLFALAMAAYPGGTWGDRSTAGHRFWQNFLCDLQQSVALNGVANPFGARTAQGAMLALVAAWVPLWWLIPSLLPGGRSGAWARVLGLSATAAACAVPLLPSGRWGALHAAAIFVAGVPGLAALGLAVVGLVRSELTPRWLKAVSALFAVAAFVDAGFYTVHVIRGGAVPPLLPAAQKVAALLLTAWMIGVLRIAGRPTHSRR